MKRRRAGGDGKRPMQRNLRTSQCEAHVLAGSAPSCGPGIQSGRRELSAGGDGRDKRRDRKKKKKKEEGQGRGCPNGDTPAPSHGSKVRSLSLMSCGGRVAPALPLPPPRLPPTYWITYPSVEALWPTAPKRTLHKGHSCCTGVSATSRSVHASGKTRGTSPPPEPVVRLPPPSFPLWGPPWSPPVPRSLYGLSSQASIIFTQNLAIEFSTQ